MFSSPVYSLDTSSNALEKYTKKISNKFTRTYCNTTNFGISYEGALAFAIGETNKEFKKNKLNKLIDYSLLKDSIVNDLENNCQVYDFDINSLENLNFN
jgi:2-keto-4-pentenoate hydratase/2-oxohepta-3-ene-1,7-dioic acid hydratase in catechol pathway